ncbi:hypothetical protein [Halpernia frigidisoli]|uniref:hypothetical protein n=1 Tax=Halpernia frigidisoli TaxID=1125876 RepID=UPI0015A732A4|nr:hypothetical protein [Halpernia frigidisoli]
MCPLFLSLLFCSQVLQQPENLSLLVEHWVFEMPEFEMPGFEMPGFEEMDF